MNKKELNNVLESHAIPRADKSITELLGKIERLETEIAELKKGRDTICDLLQMDITADEFYSSVDAIVEL